MTAITFDTHAFVKRFKSAGFTEEQAETQVRAISEAMEAKDLATKGDLIAMEGRLRGEVHTLRQDSEGYGITHYPPIWRYVNCRRHHHPVGQAVLIHFPLGWVPSDKSPS